MKSELTQEQKRIKIAEACGWRKITKMDSGWYGWKEQGPLEDLPDYFNDLNAMHEAENVLAEAQMTTMSQYLHRRLGMLWGFATAEQRAEAFGKTLGLW